MGDYLGFLKFAATFLSGVGAIIAAIPDERRKNGKTILRLSRFFSAIVPNIPGERRENRKILSKFIRFFGFLFSKETGLYIAIIGFFVAVICQLVENKIDKENDDDAKRSTQRLLTNILRLETRFDTMRFDLTCIYSAIDCSLTNLCPPAFSSIPVSSSTDDSDTSSIVYSQNIVGYENFTNRGSIQTLTLGFSNIGTNTAFNFPTTDQFTNVWKYRGVSDKQINEILELQTVSALYVNFWGQSNSVYGNNFNVTFYCDKPNDGITYSYRDNTIKITYTFQVSGIGSPNKDFASINDLPNESIGITLLTIDQYPDALDWAERVKTVSGDLKIGDFSWPLSESVVDTYTNRREAGVTASFSCPFKDMQILGY
jgi:hypothetical protein